MWKGPLNNKSSSGAAGPPHQLQNSSPHLAGGGVHVVVPRLFFLSHFVRAPAIFVTICALIRRTQCHQIQNAPAPPLPRVGGPQNQKWLGAPGGLIHHCLSHCSFKPILHSYLVLFFVFPVLSAGSRTAEPMAPVLKFTK